MNGPARRAVKLSPVGADGDFVGKLALRRKISRDVYANRRMVAKIRRPIFGIEDNDLLVQLFANQIKRCGKIGITTNQCECSDICGVGVVEHFRGNVHVRSLFFEFHDMNQFSVIDSITREALFVKGGKPGFVFVVCAKDDVDATMCGKGLKVEVLTFDGGLVEGKRLDVRRKVFDGYNRVSLRKKGLGKGEKIEPLVVRSLSEKAKVEIARVNVYIRLHKRKVPDLANRDLVPLWLSLAAG